VSFAAFTIRLSFKIRAQHSLTSAERHPHWHDWQIVCTMRCEANRVAGWTMHMDDARARAAAVVNRYDGADLSTIFRQPTGEVLAAAILDELPPVFDAVSVSHVDGWECEIERRRLPDGWLAGFRL